MPYLVPTEGLKVYDPDLKSYLPAEGRDKTGPLGRYWQRLLVDGAIVEQAPPKSTKTAHKQENAEAAH